MRTLIARLSAIALTGALLTFSGLFSASLTHAASPTADGLTLVLQELMPDGSDRATISWTSANAGPQTLVISTTPNFVTGTTMTSESLPSAKDTYAWAGLQPNLNYYARVDTATPNGTVSSPSLGFVLQGLAPYLPGYNGNYYVPNPTYQQPAIIDNPLSITGGFTGP